MFNNPPYARPRMPIQGYYYPALRPLKLTPLGTTLIRDPGYPSETSHSQNFYRWKNSATGAIPLWFPPNRLKKAGPARSTQKGNLNGTEERGKNSKGFSPPGKGSFLKGAIYPSL